MTQMMVMLQVLLSGGGATDLFVPCMDNGWCFGYTCQKRLSSFWMVVASNMTYDLNFTGEAAPLVSDKSDT